MSHDFAKYGTMWPGSTWVVPLGPGFEPYCVSRMYTASVIVMSVKPHSSAGSRVAGPTGMLMTNADELADVSRASCRPTCAPAAPLASTAAVTARATAEPAGNRARRQRLGPEGLNIHPPLERPVW